MEVCYDVFIEFGEMREYAYSKCYTPSGGGIWISETPAWGGGIIPQDPNGEIPHHGGNAGADDPIPNPEVDTKDPSFANTKANCVFKKLVGAEENKIYSPNTVVGQNLRNFWSIDGFNCNFVISDTVSQDIGAWTWYKGCKDVTIILNKKYIEEASALEIARTFIHETMHAYIFSEIALQRFPSNYLGVGHLTPDVDFGVNWNFYRGIPNSQHEYMATNYISTVVNGLKDFLTKNPSNEQFSDSELEYIAWVGLLKTNEYNQKLVMVPDLKTKIENALHKAKNYTYDCN
jgi:hypothetical protein